MTRIHLAGLCALVLTALAAHDLRAEEDIHIPGTVCRPVKADVDKISYNNLSVSNESTALAHVVCPIQYQINPDTIHPVRVEFKVIDRSTSGNFKCTLTVYNSFDIRAGQVLSAVSNSSNSNGNTVQTLTINLPASLPGVVHSAKCDFPGVNGSAQSEIVSYRMFQVP
jgi:hypothetical protein